MNEVLPAKVDEADAIPAGRLITVEDVPEIRWDGCRYELAAFKCPKCEKYHYRVARFAGAFYSLYIPPEDFEPSQFEAYCQDLHENLQIDSRLVLADLRQLISNHNSEDGIQSDGSYLDQLMDFARLRLKALAADGGLEAIQQEHPGTKKMRTLKMAFELGFAASELRMKDIYEDAIFEGWRLQEGREHGREAAALAKERATRETRAAIKAAAQELYKSNPALIRNDSATARAIEGMHLPALCRQGRTSIGSSAIVKHLRVLHKAGGI